MMEQKIVLAISREDVVKAIVFYLLNVHHQVRPKSQSLPDTSSLVRIIPLGHSARARWPHFHETVLQPLHQNAQIAVIFSRDSSDEPFHVL
jgi:hypothetical protein